MRLRMFLSLLIAFCAPALIAQTLTIGNPYLPWVGWAVAPVQGVTYIDLVHPATATGVLTEADFVYGAWEPPCQAAAKIKFFRRDGNTLTVIAERGPFDAPEDNTHVQLLPPVQVRAGDLIGVVDLKPHCGGCFILSPSSAGQYLAYPTDVTGTLQVSAGNTAEGTINASATGTAGDYPARIIPVVGSADGAYGSQWKTSVQLLNPHPVAARGQLIFRPARVVESATYSSISYSLDPGATRTIVDVGAEFGWSGLGSVDVMTNGGVPPVVIAHLRHLGNGGAVSATEEAIDPFGDRVLTAGATGHLIAPYAWKESRFNIGVRTLAAGATITATLLTSTGESSGSVTKEFPPDYFEQFTANEFFNAFLTGGESIAITVAKGSAIVYGSAIDNVTNDPSIQHVVLFVPMKAQ